MTGLENIPGPRDLLGAYERLQSGARLSAFELALWSQWARFDPRLGEQWISAVLRDWREIPALDLNRELSSQPWPSAAGVLLEQALVFGTWPAPERRLFRDWSRLVMSGIAAAGGNGQFFIGLRAFGGQAMRGDAELSLKPYLGWGYLGKEILRNKASSAARSATIAPRELRQRVIGDLIRTRRSFRVSEYLAAIGFHVSRRQAELDLRADPRLECLGNTRARVYRARRPGARRP